MHVAQGVVRGKKGHEDPVVSECPVVSVSPRPPPPRPKYFWSAYV